MVSSSGSHDRHERRRQSAMVRGALSKLPAELREVLILRHVENNSFADIACRMGRSLETIKKLWRRGLVELRNQVLGDDRS